MVFKRLLGSLGVGGPTVDTVLDGGAALPGGTVHGHVHLKGGSAAFDIEHIVLELVARVEVEHDDGERDGTVAFDRFTVAFDRFTVGGAFRLGEGEERSVPFSLTLPWETPVTELHGQPLGVVLGVRTELAVAGAKDKGDLDPLAVRPLPVQEAVLEAFGQLGFGFKSADLEYGRIVGTGQRLPFYQEVELTPSPAYAHAVSEIEVTFLAGSGAMEVVLEADRRGGPHGHGGDALTRFTVSHADASRTDWNAEVDGWMRQLTERHGTQGAYDTHGGYGYGDHVGHQAHHDGHHGDGHQERRSGPGMGTVVAAGAAGLAVGVVGGMVAAEVVDEVGDLMEGDEEEEE